MSNTVSPLYGHFQKTCMKGRQDKNLHMEVDFFFIQDDIFFLDRVIFFVFIFLILFFIPFFC